MAQRTQLDDCSHPLHEAYACLLANGLDGAGEALRILVNEASRIERAQHLQATPYEHSAQRVEYANGYKEKNRPDSHRRGHLRSAEGTLGRFLPQRLGKRGSRFQSKP